MRTQTSDMLRHLEEGSFDGLRPATDSPASSSVHAWPRDTGMTAAMPMITVHEPARRADAVRSDSPALPVSAWWAFSRRGFYDRRLPICASCRSTRCRRCLRCRCRGQRHRAAARRYLSGARSRLSGGKDRRIEASSATTWMEQSHGILNALKTERIVTAITIGLIVMIGRAEHSDHADHDGDGEESGHRRAHVHGRAAGADPAHVHAAGRADWRVGTAIGLVAGYTLLFRQSLPLVRLDGCLCSRYVPFAPRALDGLWIAVAALLISFAATLIPPAKPPTSPLSKFSDTSNLGGSGHCACALSHL